MSIAFSPVVVEDILDFLHVAIEEPQLLCSVIAGMDTERGQREIVSHAGMVATPDMERRAVQTGTILSSKQ